LPRLLFAALTLAAASSAALAQVLPGGALPGREREQVLPQQPVPRAQPGVRPVALPSSVAPPGAAETALILRRVVIVGSTVYSAAELAPLYQLMLGRKVSLQAVYDLAQSITAKYGADGYVLTRAIVPPQELNPSGATVRIEVIEGWIDEVEWPREKLARYRDFFTHYSAKITGERPANIRTMERYLLLANDLPGLRFTTSLKASKKHKGASTLVVEVTEKRLDVLARVDNRGTLERGPVQFLIAPTVNNLLGKHEAVTFAYALVSPPRELQFVAPSWKQVLTAEGLTAFVNASYSWGYPGTALLREISFRTWSFYLEGGASYPIIRSRERNLTVAALMFMSDNYSYSTLTDPEPFNVDRLRGFRVRVEGDRADSLNGINQFSATFSQGIDGLGSTDNGQILASRIVGRVDFSKVEAYVGRLQTLPHRFSALIAAYGQYAMTPLLTPEQCSYGGRTFGRAFDPSEILGDHCLMGLLEFRYDWPIPVSPAPSVQLYGYTDKGQRYNRDAVVGTAATVTGASAGGGVRLGWQNHFNVDVSAAKAIEGPRDDWRFFFIATARN
jgi:hemolysin activation/secretion protein